MSWAIKFRAWDNANNEWLNKEDAGCLTIYLDGRYEIDRGWVKVFPDLIIERYTGLKDENGKEIYEGDIIESTWNGDKAEVVWNDVEGEWEHYADFNTHSKYSGSVVIGTIHENPELLGGEE